MHVTCMCQGRFVQLAVVVIHYGHPFFTGFYTLAIVFPL